MKERGKKGTQTIVITMLIIVSAWQWYDIQGFEDKEINPEKKG